MQRGGKTRRGVPASQVNNDWRTKPHATVDTINPSPDRRTNRGDAQSAWPSLQSLPRTRPRILHHLSVKACSNMPDFNSWTPASLPLSQMGSAWWTRRTRSPSLHLRYSAGSRVASKATIRAMDFGSWKSAPAVLTNR